MKLGRVKASMVGAMRYETVEKKAFGNGVLVADFHFLDNALERMAAEIIAYPDQQALDIGKTLSLIHISEPTRPY